jgi:hypothetical protein
MSQSKHLPATLVPTSASERDLLARFTSRNGGFQVSSRSSYRKHEQWRNDVLRGLKLMEAEGLLVVLQQVPCQRHEKCAGQPVAVGCELTGAGQRMRNGAASSGSDARSQVSAAHSLALL